MTGFLSGYLASVKDQDARVSTAETADKFVAELAKSQSKKATWHSLLLGHVQSGKTGQLLGVIASLADSGIKNFLLLTTDNRRLQGQTLLRAQSALSGFAVVGETDDVAFMTAPVTTPVAVVLKKNVRVLQTWRNTLLSSARCKGQPLVVVDDEADATSLNTRVNANAVSRINGLLSDIRDEAEKCIYVQVTATPQAVLLQSSMSGWKPEHVFAISPGKSYLGGRYYFSDPPSHAIRFTAEDEATAITKGNPQDAAGLRDSVFAYLVNCGEVICSGGSCCNFLIHPSVRVSCHNAFANQFAKYLQHVAKGAATPAFCSALKAGWTDLQATYPEILSFEKIRGAVFDLLKNDGIKVFSINSRSDGNTSYDDGFNVVVGGNSLGRGLTLPRLQVVYYCRVAKTPQADTVWQHSRMFGYDRVRGMVRVYLPRSIHKVFYNVCESNEVLFEQIRTQGIDGVQLVFPNGIRPTRNCVIDKDLLSLVQGGVNFFPFEPDQQNVKTLDELLKADVSKEPIKVTAERMLAIMQELGTYDEDDWDKVKFERCIKAAVSMTYPPVCKIVVRRNRDISKNTGSLLSPNDRELVDSLTKDVVLVLYRLNGGISHGWNGVPFWVPNIRFPGGFAYYSEK